MKTKHSLQQMVRALCKGIAGIIRAAKGKIKFEIEWKTDKDGNKTRRIRYEDQHK